MIKKLKNRIQQGLAKTLPKSDRVLVLDNQKGETNAVAFANYVASHYDKPVYFVVKKTMIDQMHHLFHPKVQLLELGSRAHFVARLTCKYIFSTHGETKRSNRQISVNIWHGVGHKKLGKARGMGGVDADITVGTSKLSQKMLAEFFGVAESSVLLSGYPRNDELLQAAPKKEDFIKRIKPDLSTYDKIAFWMPTHRRAEPGIAFSSKDKQIDNVFNVKGFDVATFNDVLKKHNTVCLVKPHYFYAFDKEDKEKLSNILLVDEQWIWAQKMNLYQLLACADYLITDFSSVMTDFSLLDRPIICFCSDLEAVYNKDELYFEDLDPYLPSKLIQKQEEFFEFFNGLLETGEDPYEAKRRTMRALYFKHTDDKSAKRLAEHVFE